MSVLSDYIEDAHDLPNDVLLGRIAFFTISEEDVRLPDLQRWFKELQLDESFLPPENKAHDAFRKATRELDKTTYPMKGARTAHLMCRDVSSSPDMVIRQITREIRDSSRRKLTYGEAIHVRFHRGPGQVQIIPRYELLEQEEKADVLERAEFIKARFKHHVEFIDALKVRAVIRAYLKRLNGVAIRPGTYFVSTLHDDELHRLAQLVNRIGGRSEMSTIPIVNLKREREFFTRMFEREAEQSLNTLVRDVKEYLETRKKVSPAFMAEAQRRYEEVMTSAEEHMGTLQITQDMTAASAEVAVQTLQKLREKMLE